MTIRLTVVVCVRLPLTPLMVRVLVPAGVLVAVVTVSVDEPDPVTDVGLKAPVAPEGSPLTVNATLPLNPLSAEMVAV